MTHYMLYALTFVVGTVIGSFLNVCVYRIPRGLSVVKPRSACPACGAAIKPAELVPLAGYLFLRGRCSSCGARISSRYPLIELACGVLWAAHLWRFQISFQFFCYVTISSILLAVFFIDLEWMRIPNTLVLCAAAPALALSIRFMFFLSGPERFRSVYAGVNGMEPMLGLIPCAFFLLILIVSAAIGGGKSAIGMGDVKLMIPIGLALGLRQCAFAAFIAIMLGGLTGAVLILFRIKKRKDPIPFGPFIVTGAIAAVFIPASIF